MRFEWDETKNASNLAKHGVDCTTAAVVFDDPQQLLIPDRVIDGEQRWQTVGEVGGVLLLLVVHTLEEDEEEVVRMISARKATRQERRLYEDGV